MAAQGFIQPAPERPFMWKEDRLLGPLFFQCWWALEGEKFLLASSGNLLFQLLPAATHPLAMCCCKEHGSLFSTAPLTLSVALMNLLQVIDMCLVLRLSKPGAVS